VLEQALKDHQPIPTTKRLVVPGDLSIQENLRKAGLWAIYERAGFRIGPPGCSMCLGVASEKAGKGEVWISSQNRNFQNRMGEGSLAHLASGATVAASALTMKIADPRPLLAKIDQGRYAQILGRKSASQVPSVRPSEPDPVLAKSHVQASSDAAAASAELRGKVQRFGDNVDTDAIIPGAYCHLVNLEELGQHAFHHVRPEFYQRAQAGQTIVVGGEGWGSGSSREQAVWALKGAGIQAVIARSFAFIHKRNLVNEALPFLLVTDDAFYELAQEGAELSVDLARNEVAVGGKKFRATPPSAVISVLRREGGLVDAIKHRGPKVFEALAAG
jgi:3-isopropylmalate dehydratase small subunit